jgi:hypothetical protein
VREAVKEPLDRPFLRRSLRAWRSIEQLTLKSYQTSRPPSAPKRLEPGDHGVQTRGLQPSDDVAASSRLSFPRAGSAGPEVGWCWGWNGEACVRRRVAGGSGGGHGLSHLVARCGIRKIPPCSRKQACRGSGGGVF